MTNNYAATEDKHDLAAWEQVPAPIAAGRAVGIEVGHIFYFGTEIQRR